MHNKIDSSYHVIALRVTSATAVSCIMINKYPCTGICSKCRQREIYGCLFQYVREVSNKQISNLFKTILRQAAILARTHIRGTSIARLYRNFTENLEPKRLRSKLLKYQNKFEAEEMHLGNEPGSWEVR